MKLPTRFPAWVLIAALVGFGIVALVPRVQEATFEEPEVDVDYPSTSEPHEMLLPETLSDSPTAEVTMEREMIERLLDSAHARAYATGRQHAEDQARRESEVSNQREDMRQVMAFIVTIIILIAALYVILAKKYAPDDRKWAYGAIGIITGFWLRSI